MNNNFALNFTIVIASLCIIFATWLSLSNVEKTAKTQIENSIQNTLKANFEAFEIWTIDNQESAQVWANTDDVVNATQELIIANEASQNLEKTPAQETMRRIFNLISGVKGYQGFFIIDKNSLNLGSSRDENIAKTNILRTQPWFFNKIWNGETAVSHPLVSDVDLYNSDDIQMTMFVGAPVYNKTGEIIAALTFRINPEIAFSDNLIKIEVNTSGKTYAFNEMGTLIQENRFNSQRFKLPFNPDINLLINETTLTNPDILSAINLEPAPSETPQMTSNIDGYLDYRGVEVVGAWLWDNNLKLGFITELDKSQAFEGYQTTKYTIIIFAVFSELLLLVITITLFINRKKTSRNQEILNNIGGNLPGLIYKYTEDSDGFGVFNYLSKGSKSFFGLDPENPITVLSTVVHNDDLEKMKNDLMESMANLTSIDSEYRVYSKNSKISWVRHISTPEKK